MDKTILVEGDLQDGRRLIQGLDKAKFPVSAAFWLLPEEDSTWRLYIASQFEQEKGPRAAYKKIFSVMKRIDPPIQSELSDISAIGHNDYRVKALRNLLTTPPVPDLEGRMFRGAVASNTYLGDTYVYRVLPEDMPPGKPVMSQPRQRS